MNTYRSPIPWNTDTLWQEANFSLAQAVRKNHSEIAGSRRQAQRIKHQFELTFPIMDRLCLGTCPTCTTVCCNRAWVWADFKDLLFFHLADVPLPEHQLLSRQGDHCRYGGPDGCRLDRLQRPFVCSWYLCPAQTRILNKETAEKQWLSSALHRIKRLRRQMETAFIRDIV